MLTDEQAQRLEQAIFALEKLWIETEQNEDVKREHHLLSAVLSECITLRNIYKIW